MSDDVEEYTIAELYAMTDKQLGDALGPVVFILGFNVEAARIVHAAAQRLRNSPSIDGAPK